MSLLHHLYFFGILLFLMWLILLFLGFKRFVLFYILLQKLFMDIDKAKSYNVGMFMFIWGVGCRKRYCQKIPNTFLCIIKVKYVES